jgi:hypothetical protein
MQRRPARELRDLYQVYVSPLGAADVHWGIRVGPELRSDGILAGQTVLRSPYRLAGRRYDGAPDDFVVTAILYHIADMRLLDGDEGQHRADIGRLLGKLKPRLCPDNVPDLVELLHVKLRCNVFRNDAWHVVLLDLPSRLAHSCAPNLHYCIDQVLREYTFMSMRALPSGMPLTISYHAFPIDSRQERNKLYVCDCECCVNDIAPSSIYATHEQPCRTEHCWWCGAAQAEPCPECRCANYCSSACREANAATHRQLCARLAGKGVLSLRIPNGK